MGHHKGSRHLASSRRLAADEVDVGQRSVQAQAEGQDVTNHVVEPQYLSQQLQGKEYQDESENNRIKLGQTTTRAGLLTPAPSA